MTTSTPIPDPARLRFEIRQLLGSGSFGEVYLAFMSSAGGIRQEVAVKILAQDLDPRSQPVERLRDEGRLLASLNHPVILQVRDLVLLKGRIGLVTEYVPGADLSRVIDVGGPLSTRVALQIVGHVADALDTAYHSLASDGKPMHLVHRDIKPANIRLTPHGTVKLLDFGIAKAQEPERETATSHVVLIGSLPYMAPEVLHMDVDDADMARDVFALGCTLFESLLNQLYFVSLKRAELRQHSARPERYAAWKAARLSTIVRPLPGLIEFLDDLLAYAPGDRPTARQVADRAFELSDTADGPALRKWAKEFPWPADNQASGTWTGRRVAETTIVPREGYAGMRELEPDESSAAGSAGDLPDPPSQAGEDDRLEMPVPSWSPPLPSASGPVSLNSATEASPPVGPTPSAVLAASTVASSAVASSVVASAPTSSPTSPPPVPAFVTHTVRMASTSAAPVEGAAPPRRGVPWAWVGGAALVLLVLVAVLLWPTTGPAPATALPAAPTAPALASVAPTPVTAADVPRGDAIAAEPAPDPVEAHPSPVATTPASHPAASHVAAAASPTRSPRSSPPSATTHLVTPTPASQAAPALGRVQVHRYGNVAVELHSGGRIASINDAVPVGSWEVWADFGSGMALRATVRVAAGAVVNVLCSSITETCEQK